MTAARRGNARAKVALLALTLPATARAQDGRASSDVAREPAPVEIGLTGLGRLDFETQSGPLYAGAALAPRYRFSPRFSFGALGAYVWQLDSTAIGNESGAIDISFAKFRAELEGRFHPLAPGDVDLWLGVDVGLSGRRRSADVFDAEGRHVESQSSIALGPIGGIAVGVDFRVADFLALGPEFRTAVLKGRDDLAVALSLGLSMTLLFPAP